MSRRGVVGVRAVIEHGWTGNDHLIDEDDVARATAAVAGKSFPSRAAAQRAAEEAFEAGCDRRVVTAKVVVEVAS